MLRDTLFDAAIPDENIPLYQNELRTLNVLWCGLEHLNAFVRQEERNVLAKLPPERSFCFLGNAPQLVNAPMDLITCCFHWYAVSACNCVKLIGWLFHKNACSEVSAGEYLKQVLPEVKPWRDKVAAHFEMVAGQGNRSDRLSSMIPQVCLRDSAFYASLFVIHSYVDGQQNKTELRPWSLTKVHDALRARYNPLNSADATPNS